MTKINAAIPPGNCGDLDYKIAAIVAAIPPGVAIVAAIPTL
jgi:hypothetical protein